MFNLTKVALLWDWVNVLKKDSADVHGDLAALDSRVDALEITAPKDYSTTETATGQKWIDGNDIFSMAYSGVLPVISSSTFYNLLNIGINKRVIKSHLFCDQADLTVETSSQYVKSTGYMRAYLTSASSEGQYTIIIYYTKPGPTPGRAPEDEPEEVKEPEPEEKKTTKKKTTK